MDHPRISILLKISPLSYPLPQIRAAIEGRLATAPSGAAVTPAPADAPDPSQKAYGDLVLEDRGVIDVKSKGAGKWRLPLNKNRYLNIVPKLFLIIIDPSTCC